MTRLKNRTMVACSVVSLSLLLVAVSPTVAYSELPTVSLSWHPDSLVCDLEEVPQQPFRLYMQLSGIESSGALEYTIQYAASIGSAVSFWIMKPDSLMFPNVFRPSSKDATLLGETILGTTARLTNPIQGTPSILLYFPDPAAVPFLRFRLTRLVVRGDDGHTGRPVVMSSEVTLRGGQVPDMPPHIVHASLAYDEVTGTSLESRVHLVVQGLKPGWSLALGTPEQTQVLPDSSVAYEPHIIATFPGSSTLYDDLWALVENPDGRKSGRRLRDVVMDQRCQLVLGEDCTSISDCIIQATEGCVIVIPDGTYYENNIVLNKNVGLQGEGIVTIDGLGNQIMKVDGTLSGAWVSNVSFTNGSAIDGGAIDMGQGNSVYISGGLIDNCSASEDGGGVYESDYSRNKYISLDFEANVSHRFGGGLVFDWDDATQITSFPLIDGCTFYECQVDQEAEERRGGGSMLNTVPQQ